MIEYHDREWGVPQHDDRVLFEFLILEGAQAGLSWSTILNKREAYRKAFSGFDTRRVAKYDSKKVKALLANEGIVRNKLKIAATIGNARAFLAVQKEFSSFNAYVWQFIGGQPKINKWPAGKPLPASTPESEAMSKDLLKRGFRFVGPTICYAFMQAVGMVNDHATSCFRYKDLV
jgi:DNA-3-methyladenine glycosylase I